MSDNLASRILESAARDNSGDPRRHERRMAAMRALGSAEANLDRIWAVAAGSAFGIFVAAVLLAAWGAWK